MAFSSRPRAFSAGLQEVEHNRRSPAHTTAVSGHVVRLTPPSCTILLSGMQHKERGKHGGTKPLIYSTQKNPVALAPSPLPLLLCSRDLSLARANLLLDGISELTRALNGELARTQRSLLK